MLIASTAGAGGDPASAAPGGAEIYARNLCEDCHERAAIPGMVVRPLAELPARYDVDALAALLAAPPDPMPRPQLTEAERRALALYLLERFR